MFGPTKPPSLLEKQIDRALQDLDNHAIDSKEYGQTLDRLSELHKMLESPDRVSKDTLVLSAVNLLGILVIIRYEHVNVITTRAMELLQKPKIKA